MKIERVFAVYFSPTGGTKRYVRAIAQKLSAAYETIDLTKPGNRNKEYYFSDKDLVIMGAPVYAGRLPVVDGGIFHGLHGSQTPAVFNVSYGNREFEDALLEEKEICEPAGFVGIAAAAWIAPHSFSDKIAADRPDAEDQQKIVEFADKISSLLKKDMDKEHKLQVPGNHPYRDHMAMPIYPEGDENCTVCNACVSVCPVGAISPDSPRITDTKKCISCLACVKICPVNARNVMNPMFSGITEKLEAGLMNIRSVPKCYD